MKLKALYIVVIAALLAGCKGILPENETILFSAVSDTLYFNSAENGPFQVFTKRGTGFQQLITDEGFDYWWVRISPDRQHFLCYKSTTDNFFRENDYTNAQLWMFNIDGTNGKQIVGTGEFNIHAQGYATWHPNGKNIIFAAEIKDPADDNNYRWHLFVTDTVGTTAQQLTSRSALFAAPVVNATGNKIAYTAFPEGVQSGSVFKMELFTADFDVNTFAFTNETRLTTDQWWDQSPVWSPSGDAIVFSTATTETNIFENVNLRKYTVATTDIDVLRADGGAYNVPAWDKNGGYLYVQFRANAQRPFSLGRINADGTGFAEIIKNEAADLINPVQY